MARKRKKKYNNGGRKNNPIEDMILNKIMLLKNQNKPMVNRLLSSDPNVLNNDLGVTMPESQAIGAKSISTHVMGSAGTKKSGYSAVFPTLTQDSKGNLSYPEKWFEAIQKGNYIETPSSKAEQLSKTGYKDAAKGIIEDFGYIGDKPKLKNGGPITGGLLSTLTTSLQGNSPEIAAANLGRQSSLDYINSKKYKKTLMRELKRSKASDYPGGVKPTFKQLHAERAKRVENTPIEDINKSPYFWGSNSQIGQNLSYPGKGGSIINKSYVNPAANFEGISLEDIAPQDRLAEFADAGIEESLHGSHVPENKDSVTGREVARPGDTAFKNITPYAERLLEKTLAKPEEFNFSGGLSKEKKLTKYALTPTEVITQIPKLKKQAGALHRKVTRKDVKKLANNPSLAGERMFNALTGQEKPYKAMKKNPKRKKKAITDLKKILNNIAFEDTPTDVVAARYGGKLRMNTGGIIDPKKRGLQPKVKRVKIKDNFLSGNKKRIDLPGGRVVMYDADDASEKARLAQVDRINKGNKDIKFDFSLNKENKLEATPNIKTPYRLGGKMKYASGGIDPNTNATSVLQTPEMKVDTKGAEEQAMTGNIISGVGAAASLIPGVGPIIGAGLGLVGSMVSATAQPTVTSKPIQNTNPYGYNLGGKMDLKRSIFSEKTGHATGGELEAISENSVQVKADNPGMTDSVETPTAKLDHNEVVTGKKVYSDDLTNPDTGRSFAKDEEKIQKLLSKFQKSRDKLGDNEYKDDEYLNKSSEALFEKQEALATEMGLRNEDGSPVQQGFRYGGKLKYANGGPGDPLKPKESFGQITAGSLQFQGAPYNGTLLGLQQQHPNQVNTMQQADGLPEISTALRNNISSLLGKPGMVKPYINPGNKFAQSLSNIGSKLTPTEVSEGPSGMGKRLTTPLNTINLPQLNNRFNELTGEEIQANSTRDLSSLSSADQKRYKEGALTNSDVDALFTEKVKGIPEDDTAQDSTEKNTDKLVNQNPWGTAGTAVGLASNFANRISNRPSFVNYDNIGQSEIRKGKEAIQAVRRGESNALSDADAQGTVARKNLSNRSIQSRNANLRNIATGISKTKAGIRGQFAQKLASTKQQVGQRETAIQGANRQKDMQVDVINTQEADAVRTEAMKMDNNARKLLIEAQFSQNANRRNKILTKLMRTKNFTYNEKTGQIEFGKISIDPETAKLTGKAKSK